jgi:hypothetical protein
MSVTDIVPAGQRTSAIASMSDLERGAKAVAASGLFGMKTVDQALVLMLLCQSEGKDPIQAVRQYHIINGRPSMRADAMQAEFQARGGAVEFHERTEEACDASFVWGATRARIRWTMADAKKAGLTAKPGPWQQFPRAMLHARCVSEGVRAVMPGVVAGIYTPEEVAAFEPLIVEDVDDQASTSRPALPSTTQRAPQPPRPPVDVSAPQTDGRRRPDDPELMAAIKAFGDTAREWRLDIVDAASPDRPAMAKVTALFKEVRQFCDRPLDRARPSDWKTATDALPEYARHVLPREEEAAATAPPPHPVPAVPVPPAPPQNDFGDDFEDLGDEDPFGDDPALAAPPMTRPNPRSR